MKIIILNQQQTRIIKRHFLTFVLLLCIYMTSTAQPAFYRGQFNSWGSTALIDKGSFRQVRFTCSSNGSYNYKFVQVSNDWGIQWGRNSAVTYSLNTKLVGGVKGTSGNDGDILLTCTSGNRYTFNLSEIAGADNNIGVLETNYDPKTISTPTRTPATPNNTESATVGVSLSAAKSTGENVYVRYTIDDWVTSVIVAMTTGSNPYTGVIPAQLAGKTVKYYFFTSNLASIATPADADYYTLELLNNSGSNYQYTVATANATTPTAQPTNITFGSITPVNITVGWTAASPAADGYVVLRGTSTPNTNPSDGTALTVGSTLGNATVDFAGGGTSATPFSSLSDNTTYYYKIYSYNGAGSGIKYLTTDPLSGNQLTSSVAAPTANTATFVTGSSFQANWSASVGAVSYRLDVATDNLFSNILAGYKDLTVSGTSRSVTGLSSGTPYYYRVRAVGSNSTSGNSNTINPTTSTPIVSNAVTGDWASTSSWVGGVIPTGGQDVVIVSGAVITRSTAGLTQSGRLDVDEGGTFKVTASITTSGSIFINGTFIIGGSLGENSIAGSGVWTYGPTSTLVFNSSAFFNIGALYNQANGFFWPVTAGMRPQNVSILSGGVQINNNGNSKTIDGVLRVSGTIQLLVNDGNKYIVNGTLQIDAGGVFLNPVVTYGANSTLKFNTGTTITSMTGQWITGSGGPGVALPANVQISGNTTLTIPASSNYQTKGNLTIDANSTLNTPSAQALTVNGNVTINGTMNLNGDVKTTGDWTVGSSGSQINNLKAIFFNKATGNQTITKTGGGVVYFDYLVIDKATSGNVIINSSPATDVTINTTTLDVLEMKNTGGLDLNGRTLTLNNNGGNIKSTGAARTISSTGSGTFAITGTKTVTSASSGSLVFGPTVTVKTSGANVNFGSSLTTINGTLELTGGNVANSGAPIYGSSSLLKYNTGSNYGASEEWYANTTGTGAGVPQNVTIAPGSSLYFSGAFFRQMRGDLNFSNPFPSTSTLALSNTSGGDLRIGGSWNRASGGTFAPNGRQVSFNGSSSQTITASGGETFAYLDIDNSAGVALASDVTVTNALSLTNGNVTLGSNNLTISSGNAISGYASGKYIKTDGSGQLKQVVAGSAITYPVGKSAYNPITLTNSGTPDTYGIRVADDAVPNAGNAAKTIKREWYITEATAGGGNLTPVELQYNSGDQETGFATGTTPYMGLYNGSAWTMVPTTLAGSDPYTATSTGSGQFPGTIPSGSYLAIGKDNGLTSNTAPTISDFTPSSGYTGTAITITGSNFTGATAVNFGGTAAASFIVDNDGQITAYVAAGTSGNVTVTKGAETATKPGFTYSGFITTQADDWNTPATWLGGAVPTAASTITVDHAITVNASVTNAPATVTINSSKSLTFGASGALTSTTLTNNGTVDMTGGGTLTIANSGTLANNSTFTYGAGNVAFAGSGTISGTIGFNNVSLGGGVNFGSLSTINGILSINANGWVNTNAPAYANGSTLKYNSGGPYDRATEWSTTTGAGYPYNVQISNSTLLNMGANSGAAIARECAGSLTVDAGSTFSMNETGNQMTAAVTVLKDITNNGTISLSASVTIGGDIKLGGNFTDNGTFNSNKRAVFFIGSGNTQTIGGTASAPFNIDYIVVDKPTGGIVQISQDLLVGAPNGGNALTLTSATDIFDLNGKTLTLGTAGQTCTLSGNGLFRGNNASALIIYGSGALGTLRFDQSTPGTTNVLKSLAIDRTGSGSVTLGNSLSVAETINTSASTAFTISASSVLTINSTCQATFLGALTNSAGASGLVIKSNATNTGSLIHNTAGVQATVERYLTGGWQAWNTGWHQVSSPVASQPISGFTTTGDGNGYDFYGWAEPTNTWMNYKSGGQLFGSTDFLPGVGYLVSYEVSSITQSFSGTLNVDDISKTDLTKTGNQLYSGFHLLGNPFASSLQWNDGHWGLDEIGGVAKIWKESAKSYSDVAGNEFIPSAQGFMVWASSEFNGITIPSVSRVHNSQAYYKSGEVQQKIFLVASETELKSAQESQVFVNELATNGFEMNYDSYFLAGYAPQFYSKAGDAMLSTNTLKSLPVDTGIPFGFVKNPASNFSIELKESIDGYTIYLKDLKTGMDQNMTDNPVYTFTAQDGDNPDRFLLHFLSTTGTGKLTGASNLNAYFANGKINLNGVEGKAEVYVRNAIGQVLLHNAVSGSTLQQINAESLPAGVYIVSVITNTGIRSAKVVVSAR